MREVFKVNRAPLFQYLRVNLDNVEVKFNPDHKRTFTLHNDIGVNMNYPTLEAMLKLEEKVSNNEDIDEFMFEIFIDCIDNVFDFI